MRQAHVTRETTETSVDIRLNLDGTGVYKVATGIGFFDHMLEQLARHALLDLEIATKGDLHIDAHHSVEDTGIALGQALLKALGDRKGIMRYGHAYVPMDEALSRVAIDISGRPYLIWKVALTQDKLGTMDSELFKEFFHALAGASGMTLHVESLYGSNNHHMIESCFKALARALRMATARDPRVPEAVPSTKGTLGGTGG